MIAKKPMMIKENKKSNNSQNSLKEKSVVLKKSIGNAKAKEVKNEPFTVEYISKVKKKPEVKSEIRINSFDEVLKLIESNLSEILLSIKKVNPDYLKKIKFERTFSEKGDFDIFVKELILDFLKDANDNLKEDIVSLRKKGYDVLFASFKAMSINLKIKLFSVILSKKDFDRILFLINEVGKSLVDFKNLEKEKDENDRKELEKKSSISQKNLIKDNKEKAK